MNMFQDDSHGLKKQNISAFFVCAAGIAVNIILNSVAVALGLPLYLDCVGTVAVAAMGGYMPGAIVGFTTNVIKSISDPSSLYYGALNVLIALCATDFSRRGWLKKMNKLPVVIITFTLIGGGLGSFIPWYMEGLSFDSESISGMLYNTGLFNIAVSHILSSLIMDLPDKIVTVIIAAVILRIIPEKFYVYCDFNMWMQNPLSVGETRIAIGKRKKDVRVMSLKTKILLMIGTALTIVAVVATVIGLNIYHKTIIEEHKQLAAGAAVLAAKSIDGDKVSAYLETGGNAEGYDETKTILRNILESSKELTYLYAYRIEADGCHVIYDFEAGSDDDGVPGSVLPFDGSFSEYIPKLLRGERIDVVVSTDKYGYLITAYEPVYDSNGHTVCYAGADIDMENIHRAEKSFLVEMVSVFLGFFLLICTFVVWITDYQIIYPIMAITSKADNISSGEISDADLNSRVKAARSIDLHTGDEIEKLYDSFCQATLNQAEQMGNIRRLSESTAKMQDGMIITMADMVENRDSDTGAHIQKTAAYVEIIVKGLKEKGYFAEKLTPKFMSDTIRSAPLHDVGKISVPDEVLNKPSRLTDEEYEIMKTHTTAGKRIMEHAINTVEGDSYLKEARNMAAYHHERWDGKGYPEGLHGEVIPLSARIMAVADVFDALTSPRVYKPAFPIEKALSILEEGKGTQFDPKCVEVFMDRLDEVKAVLKKYNPDTL